MEDQLTGYVIGALDPDSHRDVAEWMRDHPERNLMVERLRSLLEPLATDKDTFEPPRDLATRTIAFVAEHVVANRELVLETGTSPVSDFIRSLTQDVPTSPNPAFPHIPGQATGPGGHRRNFAVAGGLSVAVVLVGMAGISNVRQTRDIKACENNMREVGKSLHHYCDNNDKHYPRVSPDEDVQMTLGRLQRDGQLPTNAALVCPGTGHAPGTLQVDYAYNLGYRDSDGELRGLCHDGENDRFPIMADAPERGAGSTMPINHRKGQNVLFSDGHVEFCSHPFVGPDGDDIFYNADGYAKAGKHRWDCILGRANEQP